MNKTIIGTLLYDIYKEEGEVELPQSFHEEDWVFKADLLVDWIHDLQEEYEALLAEKPVDLQ
jgi:hypothetical protein